MGFKNLKISISLVAIFFISSCEKDSSINDTALETGSQISDGFVLYSFMGDNTVHLIDSFGVDVKTWTSSYASTGGYYLSDNKTLLRLGKSTEASNGVFSNGGTVAGYIEEIDDNSTTIWSIQRDSDASTFHHDFKEVDENTIIALSWEFKEYNGANYWNEVILLIDKTNNSIIWEWSAMEDGGIIPNANDQKDYLHFNSIDYRDGMILISSRNQNTLYIINKEDKTITTTLSLGGTLSGQHDATFLDNGNILVFNNNAGNNKSEVIEITRSDELVWQYSNDFYSDHISGAYQLKSGNTLICSGIEARLIEVTNTGEEVWDYTPTSTNTNRSSEIFKARKYSSY